VARFLKISRRDLIEKDLILHQILAGLSQDNFFAENFWILIMALGHVEVSLAVSSAQITEETDIWSQDSKLARIASKAI